MLKNRNNVINYKITWMMVTIKIIIKKRKTLFLADYGPSIIRTRPVAF